MATTIIIKCSSCEKHLPTKLKHCGACHVTHYCDRVCQRAHWKAHRPTCHSLRQSSLGTINVAEAIEGAKTLAGGTQNALLVGQLLSEAVPGLAALGEEMKAAAMDGKLQPPDLMLRFHQMMSDARARGDPMVHAISAMMEPARLG